VVFNIEKLITRPRMVFGALPDKRDSEQTPFTVPRQEDRV